MLMLQRKHVDCAESADEAKQDNPYYVKTTFVILLNLLF